MKASKPSHKLWKKMNFQEEEFFIFTSLKFNTLMRNVEECHKIFKVCLTILTNEFNEF